MGIHAPLVGGTGSGVGRTAFLPANAIRNGLGGAVGRDVHTLRRAFAADGT